MQRCLPASGAALTGKEFRVIFNISLFGACNIEDDLVVIIIFIVWLFYHIMLNLWWHEDSMWYPPQWKRLYSHLGSEKINTNIKIWNPLWFFCLLKADLPWKAYILNVYIYIEWYSHIYVLLLLIGGSCICKLRPDTNREISGGRWVVNINITIYIVIVVEHRNSNINTSAPGWLNFRC